MSQTNTSGQISIQWILDGEVLRKVRLNSTRIVWMPVKTGFISLHSVEKLSGLNSQDVIVDGMPEEIREVVWSVINSFGVRGPIIDADWKFPLIMILILFALLLKLQKCNQQQLVNIKVLLLII